MNEKQYHAYLYQLQAVARDIVNDHRVCACCRAVVPGKNVEVWGSPGKQRARYRNVIRCSDVWVCPVCANQITANRRDDLRRAVKTLRPKSIIWMVSFTIRHSKRDSLRETSTILVDAWRTMTQCRQWDKLRDGTFGYVRALEVTHGDTNGWHPHFHVLFFTKPEECVYTQYAKLRQWWSKAVAGAGGDSDEAVATQLTLDFEEIGNYLTKWGIPEEMTRGGMSKNGRDGGKTPFELLDSYLHSEAPAVFGMLYREYARAMKGKRQLTWSRKPDIRIEAGLEAERSEETIVVGEEAGYVLLATLTIEQWKAILHCNARGDMLDLAGQGDIGGFYEKLAEAEDKYRKYLLGGHQRS